MEVVLISIGGAFGAVLRYGVGQLIGNRAFPWATLAVNALGSLILGIVIGVNNSDLLLILGVGFCGAFTTFSSFSFQTIGLWERKKHTHAFLNAIGNLVVSLCGFVGGYLIM